MICHENHDPMLVFLDRLHALGLDPDLRRFNLQATVELADSWEPSDRLREEPTTVAGIGLVVSEAENFGIRARPARQRAQGSGPPGLHLPARADRPAASAPGHLRAVRPAGDVDGG
jgi:hypothetical protein